MIKVEWHRFWVEKPWRGIHFYYNMENISDDCTFTDEWVSVWADDTAMIHDMYATGNRLVKKYRDLHT